MRQKILFSHFRKIFILPAILFFIFIHLLLLFPTTNMPGNFSFPHFDKLVHFGIYFALQFCATILFTKQTERKKQIIIALFLIIHGCFIEYIQPMTSRNFDNKDMIADMMGVITAWLWTPKIIDLIRIYLLKTN